MALTRGTFGLKEGQFFWPERYTGAPVVVAYTKGLVTDYGEGGGLQNGRGGAREVLPQRKGAGGVGGGGAKNVLAMLKGGHKQFWGSFYVVA